MDTSEEYVDLYVTFTGLCLFVSELQKGKTHVLLPETRGNMSDRHDHEHRATLDYAGGVPGLDLRNWSLDLSPGENARGNLQRPEHVIDVGRLAGKGIDQEQLGNHPRDTVAARITLPLVTHFDGGDTADWEVVRDDGTTDVVTLTHDTTCRIERVRRADLVWKLYRLGDRPVQEYLELAPPRVLGNAIALFVRHLPIFPSETGRGGEARDFPMYFDVFKPPVKKARLVLKKLVIKGGSPFNCMLAQSDPEP